jgi:hypothetical protein
VAEQAAAWVRRRRMAAAEAHPRNGLAWALAKAGMVSELEMLRPGPRTSSMDQWDPAVSSTRAPSGSATRKLLW